MSYGTAFLIKGGLITNSHVLQASEFNVIGFRFDDMKPNDFIRIFRDDCLAALEYESPYEEQTSHISSWMNRSSKGDMSLNSPIHMTNVLEKRSLSLVIHSSCLS